MQSEVAQLVATTPKAMYTEPARMETHVQPSPKLTPITSLPGEMHRLISPQKLMTSSKFRPKLILEKRAALKFCLSLECHPKPVELEEEEGGDDNYKEGSLGFSSEPINLCSWIGF